MLMVVVVRILTTFHWYVHELRHVGAYVLVRDLVVYSCRGAS